ncbi:MAG: MATE family efflux transporter [Gammaproteobacteria bacterium]
MNTARPDIRWFAEVKSLVVLALPLIVNNVAISLTSFLDVVMAGRLGAEDLAAVGVGSAVWATAFLFGLGVLMALSPTVAHLAGDNKLARVGGYFRQSLYIALVLAALMIGALYAFSAYGLAAVGVSPDIIPRTQGYVTAIVWGLPLMYPYLCLRYTSEGIGHTAPIMYIAVATVGVNFLGNYMLMYGNFGAPALGATGCGIASAISMWFSFFALLAYVRFRRRVYGPLRLFRRFDWPNRARLKELLWLGLPIGGSTLAEITLFSAAGIIMGVLGANEAAAHAIAINYAATMFMIPLAVHSAITVRVGQALGRRDPYRARFIGWMGVALCGLFMTLSALVLVLLREPITLLYSTDPVVREIAVGLLFMAMIFQISDGLQVGAAGALRGYKDSRVPLFINIFAYWLVGFPVAVLAGLKLEMGPGGVWMGLAFGLTVAAVFLGVRFWRLSKVALERHLALPTTAA